MNYSQRIRNRLAQFPTADVRADCADIAAEADAELAALRAELAAAKQTRLTGEQVDKLFNELAELAAETAEHDEYVSAAEKDIAERDDVIDRLQAELAAVKRDAADLTAALQGTLRILCHLDEQIDPRDTEDAIYAAREAMKPPC